MGTRTRIRSWSFIPHESPIVQFMFRQFSQEPSLAKLREKLRLRGYMNRAGKEWDKTAIMHILKNPVYCGKIRIGEQIYKGLHESIVEEALFLRIERLTPDRTHPKTKIERPFLLKGLIRCSYCGSYMTPHYTLKHRKDGSTHAVCYYRCTKTTHFNNQSCKIRHINADFAENWVISSLTQVTYNDVYLETTIEEINKNLLGKTNNLEKEVDNLKKSLEEVESKIDRYVKAIGEGTTTAKLIEKEIKVLTEDKRKLEIQYEAAQIDFNSQAMAAFDVQLIKESLKSFRDSFGALTTEEKAQTLQKFLKTILVYPEKMSLDVYELPTFSVGSQKRLKWLPGLDSNWRTIAFEIPLFYRPGIKGRNSLKNSGLKEK